MKILVTGGAGFIGSHLVDRLVEKGYQVRVFDNLESQVHGDKKPEYLNKEAEYIWDDVRNYEGFKKVLKDIDIVYHFASAVGVGQSQYQVRKYVEINNIGTANLWDIIINSKNKVKKVIISASMSSYGEGLYQCKNCGILKPTIRKEEQLKKKQWELLCPNCKTILNPIATSENVIQECQSVYALTKKNQEEISLLLGKTYGIPVVNLRFFNAYGPRQSLSNPYTGVCAIFISRIKNDKQPLIFEDGKQSRDFISVYDIVNACILAMEKDKANFEIFNVGSGKKISIIDVAKTILELMEKDIALLIPNWYRKGDIRHCYADIRKIRTKINWQPKIPFKEGMKELIEWAKKEPSFDKFDNALNEIKQRNLIAK
jgi:dTDP-L-rhamnose 4-epimerase